jgi:tRNA-binding protein
MTEEITYSDFERVDIRVGTIIEASPFPEARKPAFKLLIDFGPEIGVKKSSAQITVHYTLENLVGTAGACCRQLSAAPDRAGPLRGADARLRGRGGRDRACRTRTSRCRTARRSCDQWMSRDKVVRDAEVMECGFEAAALR